MKIGILAKAVNCHVETVRYYEKEGILPSASRTTSGHGEYSDIHFKLLCLIRHAKEFGFSQTQTRELVQLTMSQDRACDEVYQITLAQLDVVAEKLRGLRKIQRVLKNLSTACEQSNHEECPVLEHLVADWYKS